MARACTIGTTQHAAFLSGPTTVLPRRPAFPAVRKTAIAFNHARP